MAHSVNSQQYSSRTCTSCEARHAGICSVFEDLSAAISSNRSHRARYESGDEIAIQGERSEKLGIIASGLVKIVLITEDGENHLLQLLKPGDMVGDPCQQKNVFSWEAATTTDICWINRPLLETMMLENPQINRAYLEVTARQLEAQRLWSAAMRGRNALQRIAFWIIQQVPKANGTDTPLIGIALTRRDLASLLDMTVETLCRGLHQLSDRKAITLPKPTKIEISNLAKLRLFARCEQSGIGKLLESSPRLERTGNPFCVSKPQRGERGLAVAKQALPIH